MAELQLPFHEEFKCFDKILFDLSILSFWILVIEELLVVFLQLFLDFELDVVEVYWVAFFGIRGVFGYF